jgi:glucose/arabinose dehydrogenase
VPMFTLARFRESGNTLADRIVLLDGIRASPSPTAALRFGSDKKLYVAVDDGGDASRGGDAASLNGKILRLNADGTTPADQARMSPVYAGGNAAPRGFEWDRETGRPSAAVPTSTAVYAGRLLPRFAGGSVLAGSDGRLVWRSARGGSDILAADRIGGVTAVAVSPDGAIYFATANAIGRLVPDTLAP